MQKAANMRRTGEKKETGILGNKEKEGQLTGEQILKRTAKNVVGVGKYEN